MGFDKLSELLRKPRPVEIERARERLFDTIGLMGPLGERIIARRFLKIPSTFKPEDFAKFIKSDSKKVDPSLFRVMPLTCVARTNPKPKEGDIHVLRRPEEIELDRTVSFRPYTFPFHYGWDQQQFSIYMDAPLGYAVQYKMPSGWVTLGVAAFNVDRKTGDVLIEQMQGRPSEADRLTPAGKEERKARILERIEYREVLLETATRFANSLKSSRVGLRKGHWIKWNKETKETVRVPRNDVGPDNTYDVWSAGESAGGFKDTDPASPYRYRSLK